MRPDHDERTTRRLRPGLLAAGLVEIGLAIAVLIGFDRPASAWVWVTLLAGAGITFLATATTTPSKR